MKKRTRLFFVGAAGILVLGLGTGLVASYVGLQNFVIVGSDGPDELRYVPRNAEWVAFANVREVMDSELRQKLRALHPEGDRGADRFKAETGIDIETDVDHVVASAVGFEGGEGDRPLLLARGRFDQVRIEGLALQHGGTATDYNGKRLVSTDSGKLAVAFLEPTLVAVGTSDAVRGAIDMDGGDASIKDNAELMALLRDVDDGNAWAVARFDALARGRGVPRDLAARLPAITWFAASGHVNGGVRGSVRAVARDEMSAQDLRQVIQGFMALARMQTGQRTDLADLLNSVQLSGQGNTVALEFSLPSEVIDALSALHAPRANRSDPSRAPEAPEPSPATPSL